MMQTCENTTTFTSQQKNKTWQIFQNTYCKTKHAFSLMECAICNLQYVCKNEAQFNIRLNNHRKDLKDPKAIFADKHFQNKMIINLKNTQDSR